MSGSIVGVSVVMALLVVGCSSSRDFREGTAAGGEAAAASGGEQAAGGETGSGSSAGGSSSVGGDPSGAGGDLSGAGGDPSGAGGVGALPALECPLDCLPPAPPSWTGPSAVYDGPEDERPEACPDQYSLEEVEAHQGMTAEEAECSCAAGTPSGADCTVKVMTSSDTTCTGTVRDYALSSSSPCVGISSVRVRITPQPVDLSGASCAFGAPRVDLPPAAFERVNLACGLPVSAACAENPDCTAAPLPSSPFGRLCIHKQGDHPCPGAGYGARFVAYQGIDDARGCGDCAGEPAGGSCGVSSDPIITYEDDECTDQYASDAVRGTCYAPGTSEDYLDLTQFAPLEVSCSGTATATGQAESADPVTFCCVR